MKEFTQESLFQLTPFEKNTEITPIHADMDGIDEIEYIPPAHSCRFEIADDFRQTHEFVCSCGERVALADLGNWDIQASKALSDIKAIFFNMTSDDDPRQSSPAVKNFYRQCSLLEAFANSETLSQQRTQKNFDNPPARVIEEKPEAHKVDGLNQYKVKGSENKYWRYSYRVNGRLKHIHLRGGNERTPLVKKRVKTIQSLIDGGTDHAAIAKLLKSW